MQQSSRVRWLVLIMCLVVMLALASKVLGGVPDAGGPLAETGATSTPTPTTSPCRLWITSAQAQVGDMVTVELWESWGRGYSARILYDPSLLQVVDEQGNPATSVEIPAKYTIITGNSVDSRAGKIGLYVGLPGYPYPPPGTDTAEPGVAAVLRFRALAPGTALLQISQGSVFYYGYDCYGPRSGGQITVVEPTPTPTSTPLTRMLHGAVRDAANLPIANARLALYRNAGGAWTQQASGTSGGDGVFRLFSNPIPGEYKLVAQPPTGYGAVSAQLPAGLSGQVLAPDTLTFSLGDQAGQVGPFAYVVEALPTATPTPQPQPTLPPVVLQGYVWLDLDGNGERGPVEGLAGVVVSLNASGLSALPSTVTDAEGYYSLVAEPGVYTLAIHDPLGRVADRARVIDTEAWEPGPIDWGNWSRWLPLVRAEPK